MKGLFLEKEKMVKGNVYCLHFELFLEMFYLGILASGIKGKKGMY